MPGLQSSYIRQRFQPELDKPIFIEGLPGFGNVGGIAAKLLVEFCRAKLFAEYYSPFFPDLVTVSGEGLCSLPRYKFYAPPSGGKLNVIVLTGKAQPQPDNVVAHYNICDEILSFAQKFGCSLIVTIGGVPVSSERKDVYVAATSEKLAIEIMEKGGIIYGKGKIMGATGLLLGLAKKRGLDGICLLGATSGIRADKDAGSAVFDFLMRILGQKSQ